jgi:hypothetical protein
VIEGDTPPPSLVLPGFTHLGAVCDEEEDCLGMFRGATPEVLESVNFTSQSEQIGDFLGAFKEVALVASVQITSSFSVDIGRSWNPVFSAHSFHISNMVKPQSGRWGRVTILNRQKKCR